MANGERYAADCRNVPSDMGCTLYIEGRKDEVMKAAVRHAIDVHGHEAGPKLEKMVSDSLEKVS